MGVHVGRDGVVKIGSNNVAEVRSFSLEETADTVDDTVMTDAFRTFKTTVKSFSGSADVYWDETDTAQSALTIGSEVTLGVYPEGESGTPTYYSGNVLVTGITRTASFDGMVEASITFQGTDTLTRNN